MNFGKGFTQLFSPGISPNVQNAVSVESVGLSPVIHGGAVTESAAMKLSAVNRCVEVLSDKMAVLPNYIADIDHRGRVEGHALLHVLNCRPNEAMTPTVRRKLLECHRLLHGNGYEWIIRDPRNGLVRELIPLHPSLVTQWVDLNGRIWYDVHHPVTYNYMRLSNADVLHYKAYSRDGLTGIPTLHQARDVLACAQAAQEYDLSFYQNSGRPSGVLTTESDLGGDKSITKEDGSKVTMTKRDWIRQGWDEIYSGSQNGFRTAVLDYGTKYTPIAVTNKDAQFVENKAVTVRDIARFFGVPLHFLFEGTQSYNSNEQHAIEFVANTLQPIATQYEEEQSWKLLFPSELAKGYRSKLDMMALLRGDATSRASWFTAMRTNGAYSANDIRRDENLPDVEGGDEYYASLNYVPMKDWPELSRQRAASTGGTSK